MYMLDFIWSDKKRHFGLPWSFTTYSIENGRLYCKHGILYQEINEILLYRILDIKTRQSLWQRLFGVGTIIIAAADQTTRKMFVRNIKDHIRVYLVLSELVEKERLARGIAGTELFGIGGF